MAGATWALYYLYGLERAGRLTARRFIPLPARPGQPDRADWYREGADWLIRQQDGLSGFWAGAGLGENEPLVGTSLALLFLSKGRWPVLLGKLQHGDGDDWNRHRSDVANLTRYVESRWKLDMTWQVIDLRPASVEDLLQTPVLYYCGSRSPLPDDPARRKELAQKLRDYLDRGGFLFAEGYCGGDGFDRGFRELMRQVFPEPEYKLRLLEPEHPIWYAEEKIDAAADAAGLGDRVRLPHQRDLRPARPAGRPAAVALVPVGAVAAGPRRKVQPRGPGPDRRRAGAGHQRAGLRHQPGTEDQGSESSSRRAARRPGDRVERGKLYVATLRHPGGCNAAPRAVANLMDAAAKELKIRTRVRQEPLDITDDALFDYHLVFMHGRTAFRLTDAERGRLRQYVERGGMLMADSICASRAFTESFRREMAAIFPNRKLERIPADDPLWSTTYGGSDLRTVSRRDPEAVPAGGGPLKDTIRKVPPELEGIKLGDHWGVVFSPYDLSCAWRSTIRWNAAATSARTPPGSG